MKPTRTGSRTKADQRITLRLDRNERRVALANAKLNQQELARKLKVPPTSLSDWLRGAHPVPTTVVRQLELVLKLELMPAATKGRTR